MMNFKRYFHWLSNWSWKNKSLICGINRCVRYLINFCKKCRRKLCTFDFLLKIKTFWHRSRWWIFEGFMNVRILRTKVHSAFVCDFFESSVEVLNTEPFLQSFLMENVSRIVLWLSNWKIYKKILFGKSFNWKRLHPITNVNFKAKDSNILFT